MTSAQPEGRDCRLRGCNMVDFHGFHSAFWPGTNVRLKIFICVLLAGVTLAVYWPVGSLDFIFLDDPFYVTENPNVQQGITPDSLVWAFRATDAANWHPVTWLSHMLDCELFGPRPGGPHWMNLGWHIANTLLLFLVLVQMTRIGERSLKAAATDRTTFGGLEPESGGDKIAVTLADGAVWRSAFVAALFALHPLHIQSVAWVAERKDVLSAFFFFLTLWAYARYVEEFKVQSSKFKVFYRVALLFFALGLMSNPMLVTLPLILLLLDFWPLRRITIDDLRFTIVPRLREKFPFFALSAVSCLITLYAQGKGGAILHLWWLPWYVRIQVAPLFCAIYLGKLFWPENLAIFYPFSPVHRWQIAGAALLGIGLSVFCLRQARARPWLFTGWFWFLVMLIPVIGLVQVGTASIADRYAYLPSVGIFVAVAWGWWKPATISNRWRAVVAAAATAAVLACALDTRQQLRYWRDDNTLFSHALAVAPVNNSMSYYCLGLAAWKAGDWDGAARDFRTALKISPDFTEASGRLGFILLQQKKPAEAEVEFRDVLRVTPNDTKAHKYLGDALAAQGKLAEAEAEYDTVLRLNPGNAAVSEALRPDLAHLETARTLTNLYAALKVQPTAEAHAEIAAIRTSQGEFQEAVEHYEAALRLKPDDPMIFNNLAWLLATCQDDRVRNGAQAVRYAERACALTQNRQPMMLGTLAAAYAETGRFDDAMATAQKACDLAAQQDETGLLQKNQALLEQYRAHKPWRE